MFKNIFVFLLVYFLAFYPVLTPLANASTRGEGRVRGVQFSITFFRAFWASTKPGFNFNAVSNSLLASFSLP